MSRELREKADSVMKELKELLVPLSTEIVKMKDSPESESKKFQDKF